MIRRDPPTVPYVAEDRVLHLHSSTLSFLADVAVAYADAELESCALLYGTRDGLDATVEVVVLPRQENHRTYYKVTADAMVAAAAAVNDRLLVGQVHAHPGFDVEHSTFDDEMAASRKIVSIVLPHYGTALPDLTGIGVHDHQQGYWHLLPALAAERRIQGDPAAPEPRVVDLR